MKYYIIAGEASGDLHGANLILALKHRDQNATFRIWGGDLMKEHGSNLIRHYKDLAFMGFLEVIQHLYTIFRNIRFCKKDILDYNPDVLILIDYPGFNLKIAKFAKTRGLTIFYYISPKIWAWKQSRIKLIKQYIDKMFVILPFEVEFYKQFGVTVDYMGNPLMDVFAKESKSLDTKSIFLKKNNLPDKPIIALLPGSRKQELKNMLPVMLKIIIHYKDYQFLIAAHSSIEVTYYNQLTAGFDIRLIFNQTYQVLQHAEAALVTSGTATLEAALLNIPEVVCYKGNRISFFIAKKFVKVEYISLVNLIMKKEVVKELIQNKFKPDILKSELDKIIQDKNNREQMLNQYKILREKLGEPGVSEKIANVMYSYLQKN
jgi:lipid-A-disaccharide synthase